MINSHTVFLKLYSSTFRLYSSSIVFFISSFQNLQEEVDISGSMVYRTACSMDTYKVHIGMFKFGLKVVYFQYKQEARINGRRKQHVV